MSMRLNHAFAPGLLSTATLKMMRCHLPSSVDRTFVPIETSAARPPGWHEAASPPSGLLNGVCHPPSRLGRRTLTCIGDHEIVNRLRLIDH